MPTTSDLVLRARADGELALLDEAERLAPDARAWCAIAESYPRADRARAAHALSRALAAADTDLVVYRNVARIQHRRFGDVAAASHALASAGAVLLAGDATTAEWLSLAAAWAALGDRDAADDYRRHAGAAARSVDDFCALGDVARAERAARSVHEHIAVAKLCDDAQDLDRLLASLDAAVAAIVSIDDAVAAMSALVRFGAGDDARAACYRAGVQFAVGARGLLALATIAPTDRECDRCLDEAAAIADGDDAARVAAVLRVRRWRPDLPPPLPSPAATPAELVPWSARSLGWPHEPARLFDHLRAIVSRETLARIAACDYGYAYEENLAALERLVAGHVHYPLDWYPLEVLELTRWNEGPDVDHVGRAFACTALLIDDAGPARSRDGSESTVAVLLHSALALGTVDDAIGLFAALANAYRDPLMRAFAEVALVLAATWRDAGDPRIAPVIDRLIHDEAQLRTGATQWDTTWLLGLSNFNQRYPLLRWLARAILGPSVEHDPKLAQLARLLAGD